MSFRKKVYSLESEIKTCYFRKIPLNDKVSFINIYVFIFGIWISLHKSSHESPFNL